MTGRSSRAEQAPRAPSVARLRAVLDRVEASSESRGARIAADPVGLVRGYDDPRDQEVVGLYCTALAYGRVSLFLPILRELLRRLGPRPAARSVELAGQDPGEALDLVGALTYRMTRPRDLADLLRVVGQGASRPGGLEALFRAGDDPRSPDVVAGLAAFRDALLAGAPAGVEPDRLGLRRLLPDVKKGSAAKRLFLYLRWMVRRDAVDLGAWPAVSPARLVIPLDAHIFRFARALGLTSRKQPDLAAALEVTRGLARLDPEDPVRYDFNLCHVGMEQGCLERREDVVCGPCALRPVCVFYRRPRTLQRARTRLRKSRR